MKVQTYPDASAFLADTRAILETQEAANSLMLGICGQLITQPGRYQAAPCLKTVMDEKGLVLAALMTPPNKLVVVGHQGDVACAAELLVAELGRESWSVPGVLGPSQTATSVAQAWAARTGQGLRLARREQVYELRQVLCATPDHGALRVATPSDVELVAQWWHAFNLEVFGASHLEDVQRAAQARVEAGELFLWEEEQPVATAAKTRPTRTGISIGPVYTPPAQRNRGYATACVAALSRLLLRQGWAYCALFADVTNTPAIRAYTRIGYRPLCDYDEIAVSGTIQS